MLAVGFEPTLVPRCERTASTNWTTQARSFSCRRWDSNPHAPQSRRSLANRVYQFNHFGSQLKPGVLAPGFLLSLDRWRLLAYQVLVPQALTLHPPHHPGPFHFLNRVIEYR